MAEAAATATPTGPAADDYKGPATIKVKTSDGKEVDVDMSYMHTCAELSAQAETLDDASTAIPIKVSSRCLEKASAFCKYHHENPAGRSTLKDNFPIVPYFKEFDKNFSAEMSKDVDLLFETIAAADYLGETYLLDVLCRTAAMVIKGKRVEEVRTILSIPEVSEAVHKQNVDKHPDLDKLIH